MSYSDLRKGRWSAKGQIYLVTTVTHKRRPHWLDFHAARILVGELRRLDEARWVESLAWVVMPDHLHWLFALAGEQSLDEVIKALKARSALHLNQYRNTQGAVWQKAYHDRALRQEEDLQDVSRYVIANPVRAGLVQSVRDYPHWDCVWF